MLPIRALRGMRVLPDKSAQPAATTGAVPAPVQPTRAVMTTPSSDTIADLRTLVLARHAAIAIESDDEERLDSILRLLAGDLRVPLYEWTITDGLALEPDGAGIYGSNRPATGLATIADLDLEALYVLKDFAAQLGEPVVSRAFHDVVDHLATHTQIATLLLVGAHVGLPEELEPLVTRYQLKPPAPEEYRATIAAVADSLAASGRAKVELSPADYTQLAVALSGLTINQARQAVAQVAIADGRLAGSDTAQLAQIKANALAHDGVLEYFPPADNDSELGGFGNLRRWLQREQVAFGDDARALGLPMPKGVLLVGVQGCGKSLAAKVIAREWRLPLLKLDAGRLYDKYVGESERHFRDAIATAESVAPSILWIDEIEKGMAPGGNSDADGGLSRRLFGTFLTWLQEKRAPVFVVATANDLTLLPPELLRKGRFDEVFFVDLPDQDERREILRIHLTKRQQVPGSFDLGALANASDGFSGAELEQVVVSALLSSLQQHRPLDTDLLLSAIRATVPLSRSRRAEIERLRATARQDFVPVR
jgi:ATPase family associated with various cellular activities (AAA)/AAA+ lid domain